METTTPKKTTSNYFTFFLSLSIPIIIVCLTVLICFILSLLLIGYIFYSIFNLFSKKKKPKITTKILSKFDSDIEKVKKSICEGNN
jgi:hypothetical protein